MGRNRLYHFLHHLIDLSTLSFMRIQEGTSKAYIKSINSLLAKCQVRKIISNIFFKTRLLENMHTDVDHRDNSICEKFPSRRDHEGLINQFVNSWSYLFAHLLLL